MRNYPHTFIQFATAALATLFCYAVLSKLINYEQAKAEMLQQVFPASWALLLSWLVPATELIVVVLLLFKATQRLGLWLAALLLLAFSIYIAVVMTGVFGRVPCSCGGILKNMDYGTHLVFNLIFMFLAIGALVLVKVDLGNKWFYAKERRSGKID